MDIYKYIKNLTQNSDKVMNKELIHSYINYPKLDQVTHESFAKSLYKEGICCYSILMISELLDGDLNEDSKFMKRTNDIIVPRAIEASRQKLTNKWYSKEKINNLLNKYDLPLKADNFSEDEKTHREHVLKLEDGIFEMQQQIEMFNYLNEIKEDCKLEYDEDGNFVRELSDKEAEQVFLKVLEEELMPRVWLKYERVYNLPHPLNIWDRRNMFQQWFFIERENSIQFTRGGSGGSLQRHLLGLYSHTFAYLEKEYNQKCPTGVWKYNSKNETELFKEYSSHRSFLIDLIGNYKLSNKDTINELFKDKILNYEINWENGNVEIKDFDERK